MKEIAHITLLGGDEKFVVLKKLHLLKNGFTVTELNTINAIDTHLPNTHLLIINEKVNHIDGLEMVHYIHHKGYDIPIIFLSTEDSEEAIERAFDTGVDDYMIKPFGMKELVCRIKALLKRTYKLEQKQLIYRDIVMDLGTRTCIVEENPIELTKLEFDLLWFLIQNKHTILDRNYILQQVWNDTDIKKRTINVSMNRLLKKIDPDNTKAYCSAIRGIGYRFD